MAAGTEELDIVVRARDLASAAFARVQTSLSGLGTSLQQLTGIARSTNAAVTGFGASAVVLNQGVALIQRGVQGLAAIFRDLRTSFRFFIENTLEAGSNLLVLSRRFAIPVASLSAMSFAARQADTNISALGVAFRSLRNGLTAALKPGSDLNELLTKGLGLSMAEIADLAQDDQKALLVLAQRFSTIGDSAQKQNALFQIFGRGLFSIQQILADPTGFERNIALAHKWHLAVTQEVARASNEVLTRWHFLKEALSEAFQAGFQGSGAIQAMAKVLEQVASGGALERVHEAVSDLGHAVGDLVKSLAESHTLEILLQRLEQLVRNIQGLLEDKAVRGIGGAVVRTVAAHPVASVLAGTAGAAGAGIGLAALAITAPAWTSAALILIALGALPAAVFTGWLLSGTTPTAEQLAQGLPKGRTGIDSLGHVHFPVPFAASPLPDAQGRQSLVPSGQSLLPPEASIRVPPPIPVLPPPVAEVRAAPPPALPTAELRAAGSALAALFTPGQSLEDAQAQARAFADAAHAAANAMSDAGDQASAMSTAIADIPVDHLDDVRQVCESLPASFGNATAAVEKFKATVTIISPKALQALQTELAGLTAAFAQGIGDAVLFGEAGTVQLESQIAEKRQKLRADLKLDQLPADNTERIAAEAQIEAVVGAMRRDFAVKQFEAERAQQQQQLQARVQAAQTEAALLRTAAQRADQAFAERSGSAEAAGAARNAATRAEIAVLQIQRADAAQAVETWQRVGAAYDVNGVKLKALQAAVAGFDGQLRAAGASAAAAAEATATAVRDMALETLRGTQSVLQAQAAGHLSLLQDQLAQLQAAQRVGEATTGAVLEKAREVEAAQDRNVALQRQGIAASLQAMGIDKERLAVLLSGEQLTAEQLRGLPPSALAFVASLQSVNAEIAKSPHLVADLKREFDDVLHLGPLLKDSLGGVFDGVIAGTLNIKDLGRSTATAFGKQFFNKIIDDKLKDFDPQIHANFTKDLPGFAKEGGGMILNVFEKTFGKLGDQAEVHAKAMDQLDLFPGDPVASRKNYVELADAARTNYVEITDSAQMAAQQIGQSAGIAQDGWLGFLGTLLRAGTDTFGSLFGMVGKLIGAFGSLFGLGGQGAGILGLGGGGAGGPGGGSLLGTLFSGQTGLGSAGGLANIAGLLSQLRQAQGGGGSTAGTILGLGAVGTSALSSLFGSGGAGLTGLIGAGNVASLGKLAETLGLGGLTKGFGDISAGLRNFVGGLGPAIDGLAGLSGAAFGAFQLIKGHSVMDRLQGVVSLLNGLQGAGSAFFGGTGSLGASLASSIANTSNPLAIGAANLFGANITGAGFAGGEGFLLTLGKLIGPAITAIKTVITSAVTSTLSAFGIGGAPALAGATAAVAGGAAPAVAAGTAPVVSTGGAVLGAVGSVASAAAGPLAVAAALYAIAKAAQAIAQQRKALDEVTLGDKGAKNRNTAFSSAALVVGVVGGLVIGTLVFPGLGTVVGAAVGAAIGAAVAQAISGAVTSAVLKGTAAARAQGLTQQELQAKIDSAVGIRIIRGIFAGGQEEIGPTNRKQSTGRTVALGVLNPGGFLVNAILNWASRAPSIETIFRKLFASAIQQTSGIEVNRQAFQFLGQDVAPQHLASLRENFGKGGPLRGEAFDTARLVTGVIGGGTDNAERISNMFRILANSLANGKLTTAQVEEKIFKIVRGISGGLVPALTIAKNLFADVAHHSEIMRRETALALKSFEKFSPAGLSLTAEFEKFREPEGGIDLKKARPAVNIAILKNLQAAQAAGGSGVISRGLSHREGEPLLFILRRMQVTLPHSLDLLGLALKAQQDPGNTNQAAAAHELIALVRTEVLKQGIVVSANEARKFSDPVLRMLAKMRANEQFLDKLPKDFDIMSEASRIFSKVITGSGKETTAALREFRQALAIGIFLGKLDKKSPLSPALDVAALRGAIFPDHEAAGVITETKKGLKEFGHAIKLQTALILAGLPQLTAAQAKAVADDRGLRKKPELAVVGLRQKIVATQEQTLATTPGEQAQVAVTQAGRVLDAANADFQHFGDSIKKLHGHPKKMAKELDSLSKATDAAMGAIKAQGDATLQLANAYRDLVLQGRSFGSSLQETIDGLTEGAHTADAYTEQLASQQRAFDTASTSSGKLNAALAVIDTIQKQFAAMIQDIQDDANARKKPGERRLEVIGDRLQEIAPLAQLSDSVDQALSAVRGAAAKNPFLQIGETRAAIVEQQQKFRSGTVEERAAAGGKLITLTQQMVEQTRQAFGPGSIRARQASLEALSTLTELQGEVKPLAEEQRDLLKEQVVIQKANQKIDRETRDKIEAARKQEAAALVVWKGLTKPLFKLASDDLGKTLEGLLPPGATMDDVINDPQKFQNLLAIETNRKLQKLVDDFDLFAGITQPPQVTPPAHLPMPPQHTTADDLFGPGWRDRPGGGVLQPPGATPIPRPSTRPRPVTPADLGVGNLPNLPRLATGGIVQHETLIRAGERSRPEAILPLRDAGALRMVGQAIARAQRPPSAPVWQQGLRGLLATTRRGSGADRSGFTATAAALRSGRRSSEAGPGGDAASSPRRGRDWRQGVSIQATVVVNPAPGMSAPQATLFGRTAADAFEAQLTDKLARGKAARRQLRKQ